MRLGELTHQGLEPLPLDDPLHEGAILRDHVPWARHALRPPPDPRPELPPVLEAARAVVDRDRPRPREDVDRGRVRSLYSVREFVLRLVSPPHHPGVVRIGELELVQVQEREPLRVRPRDQGEELLLPVREEGDLDPRGDP